MEEELEKTIIEIMSCCAMPLWGVAPFSALKTSLIQCSGLKRLPENAKTVITAIFPYYCKSAGGSISRYAAALDYHVVVGEMLQKAVTMFADRFPSEVFLPFCDSSPVPEVFSAQLAGLGMIGKNGLLITPEYGSFVFIGEIVTSIELTFEGKQKKTCNNCGRCVAKCPGGAITQQGICRERCVSHLTQKKGNLSAEEQKLIKNADTIWGCDICQTVCPMNQNIKETNIEKFKSNIINTLTLEEIKNKKFDDKHKSRAFMWRGKEILLRNISILHETSDNNNLEECSLERLI